MSKNTMKKFSINFQSKSVQLANVLKTWTDIRTARGQAITFMATIAIGGGVIQVAESSNVRNDKAAADMAARNRSNFFRYKMLENPLSLKTHGACAPELNAEAEYFSGAARIVGPDRGIYEANQPMDFKYLNDNAKIYAKSAKLAEKYDTSCYPANTKMTNLTPHFDINQMTIERQCANKLGAISLENINSQPTQLGRDMAEAKNLRIEIATNLAKSQNISC
jgi:hypothetical protein